MRLAHLFNGSFGVFLGDKEGVAVTIGKAKRMGICDPRPPQELVTLRLHDVPPSELLSDNVFRCNHKFMTRPGSNRRLGFLAYFWELLPYLASHDLPSLVSAGAPTQNSRLRVGLC
jgi:hypothetical protein